MTNSAQQRAHEGGQEASLGDILDRLREAEHGKKVSINDVLGVFEDRSSGVLITMLGLIAALPVIGAVPGVSMLTGTLILVVLAHSAIGGGRLHVPGRLGRLEMGRDTFLKGLDKGRSLTDRIDRVLKPRLQFLTQTAGMRLLIKIAIAALALTMFPLAFVPYGVTAPAFGIVAFGLALIARDGVMAVVGYVLCAATVATFLALL